MSDFRKLVLRIGLLFGLPWLLLIVVPVMKYQHLKPVAYDKDKDGMDGFYPPATIHRQGQIVYAREGCVYCHSQQVRNVKADENMVASYGVSKAGDYFYDTPHLLGTGRQGPDLSNEGRIWRRDIGQPARDYLIAHFINPRQYNPSSIMPSFDYLSEQELSDLTDYIQSLGAWKDNVPAEVAS